MDKQSLPIFISQESELYINTALKTNSLKLRVKKKLVDLSNNIYEECRSCENESCLKKVESRLKSHL